jgi:hypothetical protein
MAWRLQLALVNMAALAGGAEAIERMDRDPPNFFASNGYRQWLGLVSSLRETIETYDDDLAGAQAAISSSSTAVQPSTTMPNNDPATNRDPTSTTSGAKDVSQSGYDESS